MTVEIKRMRQRHGTTAAWTAANTILDVGEIGLEVATTGGAYVGAKIGDGIAAWNALAYMNASGIPLAQRGAANGVATLDASTKIPSAQLPSIAITDVFTVANQAAMLALTAQRGDIAIRTDVSKSFVLATESPTTLADWKELLSPAIAATVAKAGDTMSGALSFKVGADAQPWLTVDNTSGKRLLFGLGGAVPAVELKTGPTATSVEVNNGNFSVRADTVDTAAPEIHWHSYNGLGPSKRVWGAGIDVVGGRADPLGPTAGLKARDFVIFKYTASGVIDGFYGLHRGGNYMPTWGFGNASAANTHLLTVNPSYAEPALGGLLLAMPTAQTGLALEVNNGATGTATDKLLTIDPKGVLTGRAAIIGGGVLIKADPAGNRALAWRDNTDGNYFGIEYGSGGTAGQMLFRNLSSSTTIWRATYNQMWIDQDVIIGASTKVGFFGAYGATKQTGVAVTAAGIHAALVAYGLIAA